MFDIKNEKEAIQIPEKPFDLKVEETKSLVYDIFNQSKLPIAVCTLIVSDILQNYKAQYQAVVKQEAYVYQEQVRNIKKQEVNKAE
jgi:hypothetical protein